MRLDPFGVEDKVPEEGEIEWAFKRLRNKRSGGPSRMRAEHLKGWLEAVRIGWGRRINGNLGER